MAKIESKPEESPSKSSENDERKIEEFGTQAYQESARALREVGSKIFFSVVVAIVIWLFWILVFKPISEGMTEDLLGYPLKEILAVVVVIALALIVFTIFLFLRRLSTAVSGILVYHFGKAGGERSAESYRNYAKALDGILYVVVISLVFLLFKQPLADIDPTIPAVLLFLIVIWAILTLWRSFGAISNEFGRYTAKAADELEKRIKK